MSQPLDVTVVQVLLRLELTPAVPYSKTLPSGLTYAVAASTTACFAATDAIVDGYQAVIAGANRVLVLQDGCNAGSRERNKEEKERRRSSRERNAKVQSI